MSESDRDGSIHYTHPSLSLLGVYALRIDLTFHLQSYAMKSIVIYTDRNDWQQ